MRDIALIEENLKKIYGIDILPRMTGPVDLIDVDGKKTPLASRSLTIDEVVDERQIAHKIHEFTSTNNFSRVSMYQIIIDNEKTKMCLRFAVL